MTSYTDTEWNRVMFEKTGVKVNFLHPVFGQEKEQLNVMIASGDLTDMIRVLSSNIPEEWSRLMRTGLF